MGFGKDGKGAIIRESRVQLLGALAESSAIFIGTKLAMVDRFRMLKAKMIGTLNGLTAGESNGLLLGLADGSLSLAEVEATFEIEGPLTRFDVQKTDEAERPVWMIGVAEGGSSGTETVF